MKKLIHPIAGAIALLTIAAFWLSTALSELVGSKEAVIAVKTAIRGAFCYSSPLLPLRAAQAFPWQGAERRD